MIVHSFVKNTIYANGTIVALFVENNVMSYLQTKEPRFDDIISLLPSTPPSGIRSQSL